MAAAGRRIRQRPLKPVGGWAGLLTRRDRLPKATLGAVVELSDPASCPCWVSMGSMGPDKGCSEYRSDFPCEFEPQG